MAITERELQISNKSYTNKDFEAVYTELLTYAEKLSKRFSPVNSNESDPFVVLLKLVAFVTDKVNYNVDKNILEAFMVSCTQEKSMRELCDMLGYYMHYYEAATTEVIFKYKFTGAEGESTIEIPKFSTVTGGNNIQYVTTQDAHIETSTGVSESTPVIQGKRKTFTVLGSDKILLENINNNKLYFPELYVAQNGTFVSDKSGETWQIVDNLNIQQYGSKVYKFGFDTMINQPYLEFPDWISEIIGSGLSIDYIVTEGVSGNVGVKELTDVVRLNKPADDKIKDSDIIVVNSSAATNGKNIETIDEAYEDFKKTIGTFETLVTCRDYANYIYKNMSKQVSNIQVADRRSDINYALNVVEYDDYGPTVKSESAIRGINADELCLYPLKPLTNNTYTGLKYVNNSGKEVFVTGGYDDAYRPLSNITPIKNRLEDSKTISHDYKDLKNDDLYFIKDNYELSVVISTAYKVNVLEQLDIKYNIKNALIKEFNSRTLDWGEEIPFDKLVEVMMNADNRITNISLMQPDHSLEFVTADGSSYKKGISYKEGVKDYNFWINYIITKNILEGKVSLYDFDDEFSYSYTEAGGKFIPSIISFTSNCKLDPINDGSSLILNDNEVVQFIAPRLITGNGIYPMNVLYNLHLNSRSTSIEKSADYKLQEGDYLALLYTEENSKPVVELYTENKYIIATDSLGKVVNNKGNIFSANFDIKSDVNSDPWTMDDTNLKAYEATWNYAFSQLGLGINTPPLQAYSISTSDELRHKIFNEENITTAKRCYWVMNNTENEINWKSSNTTVDEKNILTLDYILGDNEYFFYSDMAMTELYSYGPGTSLKIVGAENANGWTISNPKSIDEITEEGLSSLLNVFVVKNFTNDTILNIKINDIITLTSGDTIRVAKADLTIKDNEYDTISGCSISYTANGVENNLPDRSSFNADYNWKVRAILDINSGPDKPQELHGNQSVTFYDKNSTKGKTLSAANKDIFKLSNLTQKNGGEYVDVAYRDLDLKLVYPALYTYQYKEVNYDATRAIFSTRDENNYEFKTRSDAVEKSKPLELSLPIPRFEELIANKSVYITLYRNDTITREVDQAPNVQISVSKEAVLESSTADANLVNNSYITVKITKKVSPTTDPTTDPAADTPTESTDTTPSLKITIKANSGDKDKKISDVRIFISKPQVSSGNNPLLKENVEDFDFKKFVNDNFDQTINKKFYSMATIDPSKQIELSSKCKLDSPAAFLDYNNVANKWLLGKIDFDNSSFEIAANCKLNK